MPFNQYLQTSLHVRLSGTWTFKRAQFKHLREPLQMAPCTDSLVGCPLKPTFLSSGRRPTKCKSLQRIKMGKKHHVELHAVRDRFDDGRTLYVLCSEYSSTRGIPSSLVLCALSIESLSGRNQSMRRCQCTQCDRREIQPRTLGAADTNQPDGGDRT